MTPIEFFSVTTPIVSIYQKGTSTLVQGNLSLTARITGSLIARQIDLTGISDGEYDIVSELPSPGYFALRILNGIPTIGLSWTELQTETSSTKETVTITVKDNYNNIVSGADAYITSDLAGANPVVSGLVSNSVGKIYTYLDPGIYYVWISHPNKTFVNPTQITVQNA